MAFDHPITDHDDLRSRYRAPSPPSLAKECDHLDDGARAFIAVSPFVVIATAGPGGGDASPKGGPPGFVAVLDDHRLAIGDMSGNNRLDSIGNLVDHPEVGLLFLVPGLDETLRVNGRATVTTDPSVLDACVIAGKRPKVAIGVDVATCYLHCAKALRRAGLWDTGTWLDPSSLPEPACIISAHLGLGTGDDAVEASRARLEASYAATTWEVGGV